MNTEVVTHRVFPNQDGRIDYNEFVAMMQDTVFGMNVANS